MASRYKGPLKAFRIAQASFPLFDGTGAALSGARWNAKGQRVIYAAESYATALLEILVHSNLGRVPARFAFIEIHIPAEVEIEEITPEDLPRWDALDCRESPSFGSRWYTEMRSAVLVVPSVAATARERNVLINQEHPQFPSITASVPRPMHWDPRLFRRQPPK
ncbi:MAG: RES domain-containing protein [Candidatus Acidiferrum sp.]